MRVLGADKNTRFAAVIDETGKLLVGEYRKNIELPLIRANQLVDSWGISSRSSGGINNSSFLVSKMIFALN